MTGSALTDKIRQLVEEEQQAWQKRIEDAEKRVSELEQENTKLREALEKNQGPWGDIVDETLRKRLIRLGDPPLDTIIREAGVILEDRLRTVSKLDTSHVGVKLVDTAFTPEQAVLLFSLHAGEQEGVKMLYRGAMQFIRNPPMHKLIEYPEKTAHLLVRLIDSLLMLLSEGTSRSTGEAKVEDVRRMLTRRRIKEGQDEFYQVLYAAGERGMSTSELVEALNKTRAQIAGVLGALGRRINNTEGLEGKGGILAVLDVSELKDGDWHYRMRPILRQALEAEKIV